MMLYPQILAAEVRHGRLGFAAAIHRLVGMAGPEGNEGEGMDLLTAKRLIHEAMNND